MKRASLFLAALLFALPAIAATPVEEVRQTEIAFAKAFADRDQTRFFTFVADDATFFPTLRTLGGKQQVVERWSKFFGASEAPFSWGPERVAVNAAGTIGLSTGPVYDANGKQIGNFTSTWVKQKDGSWKILFDGPGGPIACLSDTQEPFEEGMLPAGDGVKLHYRKAGSGPITIIMPLDFVVFDTFKQLADMATVITYDMRNRGRSEAVKDTAMMTVEQDVRDLEAVRRHFNIQQFVPIGYSYLGMVVALYAIGHPQHVSRIVQLGPVPMKFGAEHKAHGYDDMGAPDADLQKWQQMRASGMVEKTPREFCEAQENVFRYLLVGDPSHASRVQGHCDLENEWPVHFYQHMQYSMESIKKIDIGPDLAKITMPVLTIHGTKDRNAPYGGGREWAMRLPNARLVTVTGAAHASYLDDPVTVFTSIREFLRGNWPFAAEKIAQ